MADIRQENGRRIVKSINSLIKGDAMFEFVDVILALIPFKLHINSIYRKCLFVNAGISGGAIISKGVEIGKKRGREGKGRLLKGAVPYDNLFSL